MTDANLHATVAAPSSAFTTAVNILTAPSEAFKALDANPTKLVPLLTVLLGTLLVMVWYFTIVDFGWYIDDSLFTRFSYMSEEQLTTMQERMESMSQNTFKMFGIARSSVSILLISVLQAGYLSMASALNGDKYRFSHWFSLVCWTSLPALLGVLGMVVTILLSPNGQISALDLNPLTLANLGMRSSSASVQTLLGSLNLTMFWGATLIVMAYRQWLHSGWVKALSIVLAPYALIFGIWAYFVLA